MKKTIDVIYCVGDSHVNVFSGHNLMQPEWPKTHTNLVPIFKTYRLGPHLAYSLGRAGSDARNTLFQVLNKIPKGSCVMLNYGEIDCRVHLLKQSILQKRKLPEVVCEFFYYCVLIKWVLGQYIKLRNAIWPKPILKKPIFGDILF